MQKKTVLIIGLYLFITFLLSFPLLLHIDGFILPNSYKDVFYSDSIAHINYMEKSKRLFVNNHVIFNVDYSPNEDYAVTFAYFGILINAITQHSIIIYNTFFLLSLFLSGLFMYIFMKEISRDVYASFLAGFLYMSSNYIFHEYIWGHTNQWQIQYIPLIFYFIEKVLRYKSIKYNLLLGVALALQIYSSSQYALYLSFIIPLYLIIRIISIRRNINRYLIFKNIGQSVIITFLLSGYYIYLRLGQSHVTRTLVENTNGIWNLDSYYQFFYPNSIVYLGIIQCVLFLFSLCFFISNINVSRYSIYISLIIFVILIPILMKGPISPLFPYYWFYKYWPFIHYFRVPLRLFPFVLFFFDTIVSYFLVWIKKESYRFSVVVILIISIILLQILNSNYTSFYFRHLFYLSKNFFNCLCV